MTKKMFNQKISYGLAVLSGILLLLSLPAISGKKFKKMLWELNSKKHKFNKKIDTEEILMIARPDEFDLF